MLQPNSRVSLTDKGIKFYEQDILFDDYIYTGDFDIALNLQYSFPGFAIGLTNSEGSRLQDKEEIILFKLGQGYVEIIFSNKDSQKTLATFPSSFATANMFKDLTYCLQKRNAIFTLILNGEKDGELVSEKVCTFKSPIEFETYNVIYYSNKDNTIKNINIASSIPYGWVTNMQNTNGGYIWFYRDAFEFKYCNGEAEIEQPDIYLNYGKYYLKYETEGDCDIVPYVFQSEDTRLIDQRKNILAVDKSFTLDYSQKISLKFEGTKGKIKNICITTDKNNSYYRTSPDKGDKVDIKGSEIRFMLNKIKSIKWSCNIHHTPGYDHTNPLDYSIIKTGDFSYGLFDLNLATNVKYNYEYKDNKITITNLNDYIVKEVTLKSNSLIINKNINSVITDLVVEDLNGNTTNVVVENTIKKSVPGTIYSPIIVVDENDQPLDLSSSYRIYKKNDKDYYWFTNVEREYFKPANLIRLTNNPSSKNGTIIVYGIRANSKLNMDNLLRIPKEGLDTIDACANYYDILFEKDLRYVNKQYREIRISDLKDYKLIIVDYLKEDSYAINYRHEFNSYEVDISIEEDKKTKLLYNNISENLEGITYINEYKYVNTKTIPSEDCYIAIGR